MQHMSPYIHLMRLDKPIGIWLLFFPAAWAVLLAPAPTQWGLLPLMLLGAVLIRSAGCIINDLTDQTLDAQVARTRARPLASGAITRRAALALLALLLLMGLALCLALPPATLITALLALPLIIAYPWMKRITFWPQAFLGLAFNFGVFIAWAATGHTFTTTPFLLYAACFFWTLGYDTIYAVQDLHDDAAAGVKSTARLLTASPRLRTWSAFNAMVSLCYALAAWLFWRTCVSAGAHGVLLLVAVMLFFAAGCSLAKRADIATAGDHTVAGALFRHNQWLGLLLLLALIAQRGLL